MALCANPADPLNHEGFVRHVFEVLLERDPGGQELDEYVGLLANGERTRGEVVAEVIEDPGFDNVRWVMGAHLLTVGRPPSLELLREGLAILAEDEEPDVGFEIIDTHGVPNGAIALLDRIMYSWELYWSWYLDIGGNGYTVGSRRFIDLVWRENLSMKVTYAEREALAERVAESDAARLDFLIECLATYRDSRLRVNMFGPAFAMLFLQRDVASSELLLFDRFDPGRAADAMFTIDNHFWMEFAEANGGFVERFDRWLLRHGGLEEVEAAVSDGAGPLLRFALGLAPGDTPTGRLPWLSLVHGEELESGDATGAPKHGTIRFERPTYIAGIDYLLEASDDLDEWREVQASLRILETMPGGAREIVELSERTAVEEAGNRFFRLRVKETAAGENDP